MTTPLRIAQNLTLPRTAVTDTFAFFGSRGTGKTYAAGRMVEGFHDDGSQFVWVDPVGVAYGLRFSADGHGLGLDVPVFGGIHGDVPLEPTSGELVARLVVEQRASLVLDVSMMTLGQQHRFALDFATHLFHLKKSNRSPLHLVFDEAHEFLPQQPMGGEQEMFSAVRRLWKIGRNFGIGCSIVSQRPAEVSKSVVNLTERMFCGRLKGSQDRKAMEGWAKEQDVDLSTLGGLSALPKGELLMWTDKGPEHVRFFPKRTFDASKTPEAGDPTPAEDLPRIDLDAIRAAMAATIEEAKANDPKALRRRIAELEKQIDGRSTVVSDPEVREVPVVPPAVLAMFPAILDEVVNLRGAAVSVEGVVATLREEVQRMDIALDAVQSSLDVATRAAGDTQRAAVAERPIRLPSRALEKGQRPRDLVGIDQAVRSSKETGTAIPHEARQILTVLAQFPGAVTRRKICALTGYPVGGSSMKKGFAYLRASDWVRDLPSGDVEITRDGVVAIGRVEPPPSGPEIREWWRGHLPHEALKCFDVIIKRHPTIVARETLGDATGYPVGGSSMKKGLAALRSRDLIVDYPAGGLAASDELFPDRA